MSNLLQNVKITRCLAYVSGTAVREGAILDMAGYDGVLAIMTCATIASSAVGDMHWEQDSDSAMGGAADLEGSAIATAADDDDQIFASCLHKPMERYVRCVVTKNASNAAAESVLYIQYNGRKAPSVNTVADLVTAELLVSPDEGTK